MASRSVIRGVVSSTPCLLHERWLVRMPHCAVSSPMRCYVSSPSTPTPTPTGKTAAAEGWSYEQVDVLTGQTPLDKLYEERLQRIQAVFESPLPPLPRDGNVSPDFFVGFAHYDYRLRDQYRAVLAAALGVPVAAVRLSVAWSGRFDVSRFNRVQKVCGVCVNKEEVKEKDWEELPGRMKRLVRTINERQSASLLSVHLVQASPAIAEVEFAATRRDVMAAERVHRWLHERVLRPHLVVVLYGANKEKRRTSNQHVSREEEENGQRAFIEEKWLKAFSHRRIVPHVLSFARLMHLFKESVKRGEVEGVEIVQQPSMSPGEVGVKPKEREGESNDNPTASPKENEEDEEGTVNRQVKTLSLEDEDAWDALLRRAVFHRHEDRGVLPLLFIHGGCAGGAEEMRYLLHNREALDAVLLHPNDVAFKKKFMSRLRSSHSRLRMAEEMSA